MLNNVSNGFHSLPSYSFPGVPWCTSSLINAIKAHHFQCITNDLTVKNNGSVADPMVGELYLAFTQNGLMSSHCIRLRPGESFNAEMRIADAYLSSSGGPISYDVYAGLTLISRNEMPHLTGAAITGVQNAWDGVG